MREYSVKKSARLFFLLYVGFFSLLLGVQTVYPEENAILSSQDLELLKHVPQFLFSIPNPLSNRKDQHRLRQPMDIAVDEASGQIYISEATNIISVYDAEGVHLGSFGGGGNKPGEFRTPVGLFIDQERRSLFVLDQRNFRLQIFPVAADMFEIEQEASKKEEQQEESQKQTKKILKRIPTRVMPLPEGTAAQLGEQALLKRKGLVLRLRSTSVLSDSFGKIIVLNGGAHRVLTYNAEGEFLTKFSKFGQNKQNFRLPEAFDLAEVEYTDAKGRKKKRIQYYIADTMNRRVVVLTEKGEFLFAIGFTEEKKADFSRPTGIAVGDDGKIYVLDTMTAECAIFDAEGNFILVFGQESDLYETLFLPLRVKVSTKLNRLYITDMGNDRIMVYKLAS